MGPVPTENQCPCQRLVACLTGTGITQQLSTASTKTEKQEIWGGRKQVNKALHACTSWYAYAAMFGSSIDTMVPRALQRMYRLH